MSAPNDEQPSSGNTCAASTETLADSTNNTNSIAASTIASTTTITAIASAVVVVSNPISTATTNTSNNTTNGTPITASNNTIPTMSATVAAADATNSTAQPSSASSPLPPPLSSSTSLSLSLLPPPSESVADSDQRLSGEALEQHCRNLEDELRRLRESEQRLKQQHADSRRREHILARRLALKEQELLDSANQITEYKSAQVPAQAALRTALLDPAVNLLLQKLRAELQSTRGRLEDAQNELSAWKFTPDSNTGKRLMAKCRLLYQENEELGRMTSNGRMAKLEGDLALQKSFSEEVKKSQSELDDFLQELDEDVEGMQSTILFLQQELKTAKDIIATLETEMQSLRQSHKTDVTHATTADVGECHANGTSAADIQQQQQHQQHQQQHQQQQQQQPHQQERTNGQWNGVNVALCSAVKSNEVTSALDQQFAGHLRNNGEVIESTTAIDGGQSRLDDDGGRHPTLNGASNPGIVPTANGKRSFDDATSVDDLSATKKVRRSSDDETGQVVGGNAGDDERTLAVGDQTNVCNNGIAGGTDNVGESAKATVFGAAV